jgi:hypothetical protein
MCTRRPILTNTGPVFEFRTTETPACWLGYCRNPEPGEVAEIFEKMTVVRELEEISPIQSVMPMLRTKLNIEPSGVIG